MKTSWQSEAVDDSDLKANRSKDSPYVVSLPELAIASPNFLVHIKLQTLVCPKAQWEGANCWMQGEKKAKGPYESEVPYCLYALVSPTSPQERVKIYFHFIHPNSPNVISPSSLCKWPKNVILNTEQMKQGANNIPCNTSHNSRLTPPVTDTTFYCVKCLTNLYHFLWANHNLSLKEGSPETSPIPGCFFAAIK